MQGPGSWDLAVGQRGKLPRDLWMLMEQLGESGRAPAELAANNGGGGGPTTPGDVLGYANFEIN